MIFGNETGWLVTRDNGTSTETRNVGLFEKCYYGPNYNFILETYLIESFCVHSVVTQRTNFGDLKRSVATKWLSSGEDNEIPNTMLVAPTKYKEASDLRWNNQANGYKRITQLLQKHRLLIVIFIHQFSGEMTCALVFWHLTTWLNS